MLENHVSDQSLIPYDILIERSLRSVIKDVLVDVSKNGLPGDHHFYVTLMTTHPGVVMPSYLKQQYPEAITIVLQHQYEGLKVNDTSFEVWLTFRSAPERMVIPFGAITDFTDPEAQFRLQFQTTDENEIPTQNTESPEPTPKGTSENVISLDAFRPKK